MLVECVLVAACLEAYALRVKQQNACDIGCGKMNELQNKAPYINGWLVYMGAPGKLTLTFLRESRYALTKKS